jgi:hypothetical protein
MVPEDRVVELEERHVSDAVAPFRRMRQTYLLLRANAPFHDAEAGCPRSDLPGPGERINEF